VKDVACDLTARPNPRSERAPAERSNSGLCGANYQIRRLFLRPGAGVSLHDGCRRSRSQIGAMRRIWLALPRRTRRLRQFQLGDIRVESRIARMLRAFTKRTRRNRRSMTLMGSSSAAPFIGPSRQSVATSDPPGETTFAVQILGALEIVKSGIATRLRGASANAGTARVAPGAAPWKQRL
jgi:hypothetical protein